jgi:hypothetical protein
LVSALESAELTHRTAPLEHGHTGSATALSDVAASAAPV